MSVSAPLCSPRDPSSTRNLIDKGHKAKPLKESRFNAKIFERQHENEVNAKAMTLQHIELPYEKKRKQAERLRILSFRWALLNAALTSVVIVCVFADNELSWYGKISALQSSGLRALIIAISVMQIGISVKSAKYKLKRRKLQGLQHLKCTM